MLNWAIEGWGPIREKAEFSDPDGPAATRREWQRWGQSLDEFIVDCVVSDEDGPNVTTGEAWDVYLAWCDEADRDPVDSQQKFTRRLKTSGLNLGFGQSVWTERHSAGYGYKRFATADDAPVSVADGLRLPDSGDEDDIDGDQRFLDDTTETASDGGGDQEEDGGGDTGAHPTTRPRATSRPRAASCAPTSVRVTARPTSTRRSRHSSYAPTSTRPPPSALSRPRPRVAG